MMRLKFFWIPAMDCAAAEEEVNAFLASHRVVQVEKHFQAAPMPSGWALCVQWISGGEAGGGRERVDGRSEKVDYRAVLDAPTFQIFAALRTWRKEVAAAAGVPLYTVASNEQLAEIARRRVQTKAELESVQGFGGSRMKQHADEVVGICSREISAQLRGEPARP
jgi:superfamily II DNA helicase RecQ